MTANVARTSAQSAPPHAEDRMASVVCVWYVRWQSVEGLHLLEREIPPTIFHVLNVFALGCLHIPVLGMFGKVGPFAPRQRRPLPLRDAHHVVAQRGAPRERTTESPPVAGAPSGQGGSWVRSGWDTISATLR